MRFHTPGLRFSLYVCLCTSAVLLVPGLSQAQTPQVQQPRRQFVSVSLDWLYTQPLHFAENPLEDLLGTEVASAQLQDHDYETRDGSTHITVQEFKRRSQGAGVTVFPLGLRTGTTLAIRGSVEGLPDIRMTFEGAAPFSSYTLTNARGFDVGAGIYVSDRSGGWGLGSRAFVLAGIGRISSDQGDGRRYVAEGGGGLTSGPLGVELSVKFAWNKLHDPVEHQFFTVPISIRGTVTF
jgi:hypothetical protein